MPESLGKTLKKIRESRHLTVEEVSERTRIPQKIISAIEGDRSHEISSPFYARSFVRSYARFLGAQDEKVVVEYLAGQKQKSVSHLALKTERPLEEWFMRHRRNIAIAVLFIVGIWVLGFSFVRVNKFLHSLSARYKIYTAKKQEEKKIPPVSPATTRHTPAVKTALVEGIGLEVSARYNTWMQVKSDGQLVFRGILKKGTRDTWHAKKRIDLELGNAGGVRLKLNNKDLGYPGRRGEKKSIIVTKEGIK